MDETRSHLRLVGCSVAACNTEAQGAQESLSKVGRFGALAVPSMAAPVGRLGGIRAIPLPQGRAMLDHVRALWCGVEGL